MTAERRTLPVPSRNLTAAWEGAALTKQPNEAPVWTLVSRDVTDAMPELSSGDALTPERLQAVSMVLCVVRGASSVRQPTSLLVQQPLAAVQPGLRRKWLPVAHSLRA